MRELMVTKAKCCVALHRVCLSQKAALENTAKTTLDGQLAWMFCPCVKKKPQKTPFHQLLVVLVSHLKKETRRRRTVDTQITHFPTIRLWSYFWENVSDMSEKLMVQVKRQGENMDNTATEAFPFFFWFSTCAQIGITAHEQPIRGISLTEVLLCRYYMHDQPKSCRQGPTNANGEGHTATISATDAHWWLQHLLLGSNL